MLVHKRPKLLNRGICMVHALCRNEKESAMKQNHVPQDISFVLFFIFGIKLRQTCQIKQWQRIV